MHAPAFDSETDRQRCRECGHTNAPMEQLPEAPERAPFWAWLLLAFSRDRGCRAHNTSVSGWNEGTCGCRNRMHLR
ncbi:hypothetical protein ACFPRL_32085 [Pseudoclavibacter helvolus]